MRNLFSRLWNDDAGFIVSTELIFLTVILVIGMVAAWSALRAQVGSALDELGAAILALNEGYQILPMVSLGATSNGTTVTSTDTSTSVIANLGFGNATGTGAGSIASPTTTTFAIGVATTGGAINVLP